MSDPVDGSAAERSKTRARQWIDDPWYSMRMGEAMAWRAGWEAARARAQFLAWRLMQTASDAAQMAWDAKNVVAYAECDSLRKEAGELLKAISDMEPPA